MNRDRFGKTSWIAATVLLAVTFSAFFLLQNYGPESVLRRFHTAVTRRDLSEVAQTVQQDANSPNVVSLANFVYRLAEAHFTYEIVRVQRFPRRVVAWVVYKPANGVGSQTVPWIVEKKYRRWEINANATVDPSSILGGKTPSG